MAKVGAEGAPDKVVVSGCIGKGIKCNGTYTASERTHAGKPVYVHASPGSEAIMYYSKVWAPSWKINGRDSVMGWWYSKPTWSSADAAAPPLGQWGTGGYTGRDVGEGPVVSQLGAEPSSEWSSRELKAGDRVKRGPDWKWGDQDGGPGSVGTCVDGTSSGWIRVKWDGQSSTFNYRTPGAGGRDLALADEANATPKMSDPTKSDEGAAAAAVSVPTRFEFTSLGKDLKHKSSGDGDKTGVLKLKSSDSHALALPRITKGSKASVVFKIEWAPENGYSDKFGVFTAVGLESLNKTQVSAATSKSVVLKLEGSNQVRLNSPPTLEGASWGPDLGWRISDGDEVRFDVSLSAINVATVVVSFGDKSATRTLLNVPSEGLCFGVGLYKNKRSIRLTSGSLVRAPLVPPLPVGARVDRVRFTCQQTRDPAAWVQLARLRLFDVFGEQIKLKNAQNPGGENPEGEEAERAIDDETKTKWLDKNKGALEALFAAGPTVVGSYSLTTANDEDGRDPVRWTLEAKRGAEAEWAVLDDKSADSQPVPAERFAEHVVLVVVLKAGTRIKALPSIADLSVPEELVGLEGKTVSNEDSKGIVRVRFAAADGGAAADDRVWSVLARCLQRLAAPGMPPLPGARRQTPLEAGASGAIDAAQSGDAADGATSLPVPVPVPVPGRSASVEPDAGPPPARVIVSGAGNAEWNGVYTPATAFANSARFVKDEDHVLHRATHPSLSERQKIWKLGRPGHFVAFHVLDATASASRPPASGWVCAGDPRAPEKAGTPPAPTIAVEEEAATAAEGAGSAEAPEPSRAPPPAPAAATGPYAEWARDVMLGLRRQDWARFTMGVNGSEGAAATLKLYKTPEGSAERPTAELDPLGYYELSDTVTGKWLTDEGCEPGETIVDIASLLGLDEYAAYVEERVASLKRTPAEKKAEAPKLTSQKDGWCRDIYQGLSEENLDKFKAGVQNSGGRVMSQGLYDMVKPADLLDGAGYYKLQGTSSGSWFRGKGAVAGETAYDVAKKLGRRQMVEYLESFSIDFRTKPADAAFRRAIKAGSAALLSAAEPLPVSRKPSERSRAAKAQAESERAIEALAAIKAAVLKHGKHASAELVARARNIRSVLSEQEAGALNALRRRERATALIQTYARRRLTLLHERRQRVLPMLRRVLAGGLSTALEWRQRHAMRELRRVMQEVQRSSDAMAGASLDGVLSEAVALGVGEADAASAGDGEAYDTLREAAEMLLASRRARDTRMGAACLGLTAAQLDALAAPPATRAGARACFVSSPVSVPGAETLGAESRRWLDKGLRALRASKFDEAASQFVTVKELSPEWAQADLLFGLSLASTAGGRDRDEALVELQAYAQRTLCAGQPWDATLLLALARASRAKGGGARLDGPSLASIGVYQQHVLAALDEQPSSGTSAAASAVGNGSGGAAVPWAERARGWATTDECAAVDEDASRFVAATIGLGEAEPVLLPARQATSADRAVDRWDAEARSADKPESKAMDELMQLRGLEVVKGIALSMYTQVTASMLLREEQRVTDLAQNFVLMGNPGTGKTTVARVLGKLMFELGVREKECFVEMTGEQLLREGAKGCAQAIQRAMGGVLFIDEAYTLEPKTNQEGRAIMNQIMAAAENQRAELSIILAGYKQDIEDKLYASNPGIKSRFKDIIFEDYTEAELREIFVELCQKKQWTLQPFVANVAAQRVSRGRGVKGFANARSVRVLFEEAYKRALDRIDKREKAKRRVVPANEASKPKPPPMPDGALLTDAHAACLREWMPPALEQGGFELLYRATRDGWKAKDFHLACDGQDRLLLVVKTTTGFLFGGFTDQPWPKEGEDIRLAPSRGDAFVFGLEQGGTPGRDAVAGRARVAKGKGGARSCKTKGPGFGSSDSYVITFQDTLQSGKHDFGSQGGADDEEEEEDEEGWAKPGTPVQPTRTFARRSTDRRGIGMARAPKLGKVLAREAIAGLVSVDFGEAGRPMLVQCFEGDLRRVVEAELDSEDVKYGFRRKEGAVALLRGANVKFDSAEVEIYAVRPPKLGGTRNESLTLLIEDVLGPPPDPKHLPDLRRALRELETKIGLRAVKEQVQLLVMLAQVNYERQLKGEPPQLIPLNRLFLGNPGTGKTTVAKIYGRILKGLGYLSDGSVEVRVPADLIASAVGGTEEKVNAALELCRGKVLVIDEAYQFMSTAGSFGKAAIDTIVSKVMNAPGEDIAVLMLGYEHEMKKMLRDCGNPGLARRFSLESAFRFEDFTDEQLEEIFTAAVRRDGLSIKWKVRTAAMALVAKERIKPHFGNAGVVENLVGEAKKRLAAKGANAYEITHEALGIDPAQEEAQLLGEIEAELGTMFKTEHLAKHFQQLSALLAQYDREGKLDPMRPAAPVGSYVFTGSPGTGKTTAGKILAKFLKAKGVLVSDEFVCTRTALEG